MATGPDPKEFQAIWDAAVVGGAVAAKSLNADIMAGACGFAWINVKPGTSRFARWLKQQGLARPDSCYGGVCIWISDYNQSILHKEKHAAAMAEVLRSHGIKASAGSRLD